MQIVLINIQYTIAHIKLLNQLLLRSHVHIYTTHFGQQNLTKKNKNNITNANNTKTNKMN